MKIATWNLKRPKHNTVSQNQYFHDALKAINADILVLTETNSVINPGDEYQSRSSKELPKEVWIKGFEEPIIYQPGENRTTIYSKYPFGKDFKTYDAETCLCAEIITPRGPLIVYANIIGITGGHDKNFITDFNKQKEDISKLNGDVCVIGDFNISFSGHPYPSRKKILLAEEFFKSREINILTKLLPDSPDHIAISNGFIANSLYHVSQGILDKKMSDHRMVSIEL